MNKEMEKSSENGMFLDGRVIPRLNFTKRLRCLLATAFIPMS